ncbi:MAG: hypothetical protein JWM88_587 [Verrucomicrobia bacterium]|nr:hypothetical protein [Verrucomicrobiota bacterium]
MKLRTLLRLVPLAAFVAGCSHLDVSAPGSEDRVLKGMITYNLDAALPADAVVTVRVIDAANPAGPLNLLGEATLPHPGPPPIPFQVEYRASDDQLMHQVTVDVRISFGGKLQFHSVGGNPVTLGNFDDTHVIKVEAAGGRW